ncbi:hypothetical protein [Hyphomonas sp.]|uniref:hypothetical protein n=1 Tax=Hyphomonas sp. TaxID=87 RepID=UPI0025B82473|nr:hypothetical protein [Hyphomonas sp.]
MSWRGEPPVDLTPVRSEAIRWVIERAMARGNHVVSLAKWTKALVAHMAQGLDEGLKAEIAARWPSLTYYSEAGTPHNASDEGYVEDAFAVAFPRPSSSQRTQ